MYEAIFAARDAALEIIRPGVKATEVDRAAREVIESRGFGGEFKHSTGHGVGFAAIDHNAAPRLHPKSVDVLAAGMVFNVEPGIYIEDYGGMRHCDLVVAPESGAEVLTPFLSSMYEVKENPKAMRDVDGSAPRDYREIEYAQPRPRSLSKRAVAAGMITGGLIVAGGIWLLNRTDAQRAMRKLWS